MKKICFILDYDNSTGRGHLGRCINLSKTFKINKWKTFFFNENKSKVTESNQEVSFLKQITTYYFDLIIIDSYKLNKKKIDYFKQYTKKICIIDDYGIIKFKTDFYINYSCLVPKNPNKYRGIVKLLGLNYLIIRPGTEKNNLNKKVNPQKNFIITIFYSALSSYELIKSALDSLEKSKYYKKMKIKIIILNEMNINRKQILILKKIKNVKLIFNPKKIDYFYRSSYFFIGSYGYSFIERLVFKTISINNTFVKNQNQNYNFFKNKKLNINLKNTSDIYKKIDQLIRRPDIINQIQKNKNLLINKNSNQSIFKILTN